MTRQSKPKICANLAEVFGVNFSDSNSAPVPKNAKPEPVQFLIYFKFGIPTPAQTPAIIDATEIYLCFT